VCRQVRKGVGAGAPRHSLSRLLDNFTGQPPYSSFSGLTLRRPQRRMAACAGKGMAFFVVENGAVYACGRGEHGKLGL